MSTANTISAGTTVPVHGGAVAPNAAAPAAVSLAAVVGVTTAPAELADRPSAAQVTQAVQAANQALQGYAISVRFQIDPELQEPIIQVVDQDSGELIRQIPSEEMVRISKALDRLNGLLFSQST